MSWIADLWNLSLQLNGTALYYSIRYGRRDGNVSLASESLTNLPPPFFNYAQLKANFASKNFNTTELVILSGTGYLLIKKLNLSAWDMFSLTVYKIYRIHK
jgi:hypothetical protein